MTIEKISAITLKVRDMAPCVRFYNEILGLEVIYGGRQASFTSLRTAGEQDAILNLEQGTSSNGWGRLIFHVKDVDELWAHLKARGLDAARPRDTSWGETILPSAGCRLQSRCGENRLQERRNHLN